MRNSVAAIAAGLLLVPLGIATAQTPPTGSGSPVFAASPASLPSASALADADKRAMARVEQHIADLKKRLTITAAQQPQWEAFAAVMRDNARLMENNYKERQTRGAMTAVDGMKTYSAMTTLHADSVAKLVGPFEALYASMAPDQKAAADKTFQNFQRRSDKRGM